MADTMQAAGSDELCFYVSGVPSRPGWSGRLAEPNADQSDGPFGTLQQAQAAIRILKSAGRLPARVRVWIRGGRYELSRPIAFTPEDSAPVTYAAWPGQTPVFSGGRRITGWRQESLGGRTVWVSDIPEVAQGKWCFRQLFVNNARRPRPRLPKQDFFRIEGVPGTPPNARWGTVKNDRFVAAAGDFRAWRNLADVEVVALHWWIEERLPVVSFDEASRLVVAGRTSRAPLVDDRGKAYARYYVDNVFEALSEPGEWYLDRPSGRLYYLPVPGERIEELEAYAPSLFQLLELVGQPDENRFVEFLRFQGLTFEHTEWTHPGAADDPQRKRAFPAEGHSRGHDAAASQAACDVPGVIVFDGARHCALEDCVVRHVGWYGVEVAAGCRGIQVVGNTIEDMGGGGVKINGGNAQQHRHWLTGGNRVSDNVIRGGGRIFHSAVGVLSMHAFGNEISHNHISDLYYSGISCGWVWGYAESVSRENRIEKNHIRDIGQGWLSDMGGVYVLGVQPGTVVRGNLIHGVTKANYGAWALYTDEGSSHVLLENNVCYDTNGEIFHQHYGRENIVRNNVLAFGGDAIVAHGRVDPQHRGFTMERNVIITDGTAIFAAGYRCRLSQKNDLFDLNLLWDISGRPLTFKERGEKPDLNLDQWRSLGNDLHSIVADPHCRDVVRRDFTLADDSPALALGFQPIDLSDVGPRPRDKRQ